MKLQMTYPVELKPEIEKCMKIEKERFDKANKKAGKAFKFAAKHLNKIGLELCFTFTIDDTTALVTIRSGSYMYYTWYLNHFREYAKADKRVFVKEIVEAR